MGWVSDLELSDGSDDDDDLSMLFRGMECSRDHERLATMPSYESSEEEDVFGSDWAYQTETEEEAYQTEEDDIRERYMGAGKRWQCQHPWCKAVIDGGDVCRSCIQTDGKAFNSKKEPLPLPAGHHGIVMSGGYGTSAGYATNCAFYTGSETRKGHVGCTVDILPSSSTLVIHGSEYPGEKYLVKGTSKIFADFPGGLVGGTIDAVEPYAWEKRSYSVTINGTVTENPQLIKLDVGGDDTSPPPPVAAAAAPTAAGGKRTNPNKAPTQKRPRTTEAVPPSLPMPPTVPHPLPERARTPSPAPQQQLPLPDDDSLNLAPLAAAPPLPMPQATSQSPTFPSIDLVQVRIPFVPGKTSIVRIKRAQTFGDIRDPVDRVLGADFPPYSFVKADGLDTPFTETELKQAIEDDVKDLQLVVKVDSNDEDDDAPMETTSAELRPLTPESSNNNNAQPEREADGDVVRATHNVGAMNSFNALMPGLGLQTNVPANSDDEGSDRLVSDDDEEEDDRLVSEDDEDEVDEELMDVETGSARTVDEYLSHPDKAYLRPWKQFIRPNRAKKLGFANPFTVLPALWLEEDTTEEGLSDYEIQRLVNIHNNNVKLMELGFDKGDPNFYNGIRWDVSSIADAEEFRRKQEEAAELKRLQKERKKREKEEQVRRVAAERAQKKIEREASKKARAEWRMAEKNQKALDREEEKRLSREEKEARKAALKASRPAGGGGGGKPSETEEEREQRMALERHESARLYDELPWSRNRIPEGLLVHPDTGKNVLFEEVPESIRKALERIMSRLQRPGKFHDRYQQQMYTHVGLYRGRQGDVFQFRGWQVQRKFPGSAGYLGLTAQTSLAALIAAASYVDPGRLNSLASAHSWILWLIENGETAAQSWLNDANVAASLDEQELISIRSHGGRTASTTSVASTSASTSVANTSAAGSSSDPVLPPIPDLPMPDMNVVQDVAEATGAGLGESLGALQNNDNDPNAATLDLLDILDGIDDENVFGAVSQAPVKDEALAQELIDMGATVGQLLKAGFEPHMLTPVYSARELRNAGLTLTDMMDKDLEELKGAFSYEELKDFGYSDDELDM